MLEVKYVLLNTVITEYKTTIDRYSCLYELEDDAHTSRLWFAEKC